MHSFRSPKRRLLSTGSALIVSKHSNFKRESNYLQHKSSPEQELSIYEVSWAMRPVLLASRTRARQTGRSSSPPGDEANKEVLEIYRHVVDGILQTSAENDGFQSVRNQLAMKLSRHDATKNKEIRLGLLKHFQAQGKEFRNHLGLSRLLDVILDENMDTVEIPYKDENAGDYFDDHILPILVNRCPSLKTLHLHCSENAVEEWSHVLGMNISKFTLLSSLHLEKVPVQCKKIMSVVGKSCPLLKRLRIGFADFSICTDDLLSMFLSCDLESLKAVAPDLPSLDLTEAMSETVKGYHQCFVPSQLLYPFCQTLEELRINHFENDDPYVIAFILRHLPHLQQLETSDFEFKDYSSSIRALQDISSPVAGTVEMEDCQHSNLDTIILAGFDGKLSLTSLFIEGEKEYLTLKSICDLCPHLQKLHILETSICASSETPSAENAFTLSEISSDFEKLSALRVFTCTESDGPLCSAITQSVGPFLTTLEMALDGDFIPKFDFLISCINLRVLKLSTEFHPPLKSYFNNATHLSPDTFLPKLEEIQLDFCLNSELEELFLKKSTLKHIDVLCLHHLGKTDEQFLELFLNQWSQLVSFKYKMPRKFTVEMGLKIVTHLPQLRSLSLYKDIKYRCAGDFNMFKKTCRQRNVKLDLHLFVDTYLCVDRDVNDELVSTSDESKTESS